MSTAELQNRVIEKVLRTKDNHLLDYLYSLLEKGEKSDYYSMSEWEKSVVEESIAEFNSGKTIDSDEVFRRNKKWLEE